MHFPADECIKIYASRHSLALIAFHCRSGQLTMATVRGGGVSDHPHLAERRVHMKYAGLLVMPTGFFLAIAALILIIVAVH